MDVPQLSEGRQAIKGKLINVVSFKVECIKCDAVGAIRTPFRASATNLLQSAGWIVLGDLWMCKPCALQRGAVIPPSKTI